MIKGFIKEPFQIFSNFFHAHKKDIIKKKSFKINIVQKNSGKKDCFYPLFLAFQILVCFILAYSWNILFLYKTMIIDRNVDFLKENIYEELGS